MADPFTIIGTTAAVLSFAQYAGNIILTAYSLYDSATDITAENRRLEDATSELNQLLDDLSTDAVANPQSGQEKSIAELAAASRGLGDRILKLLKKTKVQRSHSVRESIRAAMATVWTKSVVNNLRKDLGFCTTQLSLHLQIIMRYYLSAPRPFKAACKLTIISQIGNRQEVAKYHGFERDKWERTVLP
jgi:hypothetical protein